MKSFLNTLLHAAFGGALSGAGSIAAGSGWKAVGAAALGSAISSAVSVVYERYGSKR